MPEDLVPKEPGEVVAIIGAGGIDAPFVREAHWLAQENGANLKVFVVGPTQTWLKMVMSPRADEIARLVERLGGQIVTVSPTDAYDHITRTWVNDPPSTVIIGPRRFWPWDLGLARKLAERLKTLAQQLSVPYLTDISEAEERPHLTWRLDQDRPWYHDYVISLFAISIAALAVQWLQNLMPPDSLSILFLTAVIFSATAYGFAAALFSSVISVVLYDFFFVEPAFELAIDEPDNILLLCLFLLASGITSNLAGRLKDEADTALRRETETRALFRLTRDIAVSNTPEETYRAVVRQCGDAVDSSATLLLSHAGIPAPGQIGNDPTTLQPVYPEGAGLKQEDIEAARWSFVQGEPTGAGTSHFSSIPTYFVPLVTSNGVIGVLALTSRDGIPRTADVEHLLESMCRLAAVAVERARQTQELQNARVISQTENLRAALLSSISHDFGTPLASIIGATSSLQSYGHRYDPETVQDLLSTVLEEAERLNRFVSNLMQMTRLEAGVLVPQLQWADVDDLISTALDSAHRRLEDHEVYVDVEERLPLINIDFILMENVLVNLIENAVKYSPKEATIIIAARRSGDSVTIEIKDNGRGIASEDLGAVFDKFFRAKAGDRKIAGTGLGLAICKGVIEAHGGTIEALSDGIGHGTTIRIKLAAVEQPTGELD